LLLVESKAHRHLSAGAGGGQPRLQVHVKDDTSDPDPVRAGWRCLGHYQYGRLPHVDVERARTGRVHFSLMVRKLLRKPVQLWLLLTKLEIQARANDPEIADRADVAKSQVF
jgi:hypothetical protein